MADEDSKEGSTDSRRSQWITEIKPRKSQDITQAFVWGFGVGLEEGKAPEKIGIRSDAATQLEGIAISRCDVRHPLKRFTRLIRFNLAFKACFLCLIPRIKKESPQEPRYFQWSAVNNLPLKFVCATMSSILYVPKTNLLAIWRGKVLSLHCRATYPLLLDIMGMGKSNVNSVSNFSFRGFILYPLTCIKCLLVRKYQEWQDLQRMKEKALVKHCQSFMQDHVQSVSGGLIFLTGVEKLHGRFSSLL